MNSPPRISFFGTAKSGLGHLRRLCAIAARLKAQQRHAELSLITNAKPAGLSDEDLRVFTRVTVCDRQDMADWLLQQQPDLAVLDTLKMPGFARYAGSAALILRETAQENLKGFRRPGERPWDVVIVPNPVDAWHPELGRNFARSVEHAGWIHRQTGPRGASPSCGFVLATGGGGTPETRALLYPLLDRVIARTRALAAAPFELAQALGPRSGGDTLRQADRHFTPGPNLNDVFRCADLVISTAGYNSVLELASTDTPALLVGIPRSLDDQMERAKQWGPRVGAWLDPAHPERAANWLACQLDEPRRRAPVYAGPNGADRAAQAVLGVLCPAS